MSFAQLNGLCFDDCSAMDLLRIHNLAAQELRRRGLTRSANNPLGDLAENLFCKAFGWEIAPPSMAASDAVDSNNVRYQIKARRLATPTSSRQLSAIRNINDKGFDILAAVIFDANYEVQRAAFIPHHIVLARAKTHLHTNSARLILSESIWAIEGVSDVTNELKLAAENLLGAV